MFVSEGVRDLTSPLRPPHLHGTTAMGLPSGVLRAEEAPPGRLSVPTPPPGEGRIGEGASLVRPGPICPRTLIVAPPGEDTKPEVSTLPAKGDAKSLRKQAEAKGEAPKTFRRAAAVGDTGPPPPLPRPRRAWEPPVAAKEELAGGAGGCRAEGPEAGGCWEAGSEGGGGASHRIAAAAESRLWAPRFSM